MRKEETRNASVTARPTARGLPGLAVGARQQLAAVGAKRLGVMLGMALVLENVLRVQKGQGRSGCVRA
jgi:hypothetical protein